MDRHAARLHAIEVEHLVDHAVQALRVLVDVARVLPHLVQRQLLVPHHLAEALDAREGRAELVADDRDELALRAVEALRLLDRLTLPPEGLDGGKGGGDLVREQREHPCVVFGVCDRRFVRADAERSESAAAAHQGHREAGVEARFLADLRATLPGLVVLDDEGLATHEHAADDAFARPHDRVVRRSALDIEALRKAQHPALVVPGVERCAAGPEELHRAAEDHVEHLVRIGAGRERGRRAMQGDEPLVLSLARLEEARGLDRDPQLPRHRLNEPHLIRRPVARRVRLIERERSRELARDEDRRRDDRAHAATRLVRDGQACVREDVADHRGAAGLRREASDRQGSFGATVRHDARRAPFVRHTQAGRRRARRRDDSVDAQGLPELLDRAAQHLIRVERGSRATRDPAHELLAVGTRLCFSERHRCPDRTGDELAEHEDELQPIRGQGAGVLRAGDDRAHEAVLRDEW